MLLARGPLSNDLLLGDELVQYHRVRNAGVMFLHSTGTIFCDVSYHMPSVFISNIRRKQIYQLLGPFTCL